MRILVDGEMLAEATLRGAAWYEGGQVVRLEALLELIAAELSLMGIEQPRIVFQVGAREVSWLYSSDVVPKAVRAAGALERLYAA